MEDKITLMQKFILSTVLSLLTLPLLAQMLGAAGFQEAHTNTNGHPYLFDDWVDCQANIDYGQPRSLDLRANLNLQSGYVELINNNGVISYLVPEKITDLTFTTDKTREFAYVADANDNGAICEVLRSGYPRLLVHRAKTLNIRQSKALPASNAPNNFDLVATYYLQASNGSVQAVTLESDAFLATLQDAEAYRYVSETRPSLETESDFVELLNEVFK